MKNRAIVALLFAVTCFSASFAQAGDFTTDNTAWQANVCGDSMALDLPSLVKFDGTPLSGDEFFNEPIPNNQNLGWGTLSQSGIDPDGVVVFTTDGFIFTTPLEGRPVSHNLDPANGLLSGFCFRFGNRQADVRIYDGDTLVDSITTELGQIDPVNGEETYICWENTDGVNVTRVELEPTPDVPNPTNNVLAVLDGEFKFGCDDVPAVTCYDQLAEVQAGVAALLADADGCDAYWLDGALDCIEWMQDDIFWEQPSGDRLSQYGGSMFIGAAYAVCYLEYVDDPAADVLIDDLLNVLECIVDNEIAYAIENGGNTCYIDNAEYFAELGDIIDDDFDNEVVATLAYRLAWLHAYYATQ